ncbi:hypothetical protein I215_13427 [Galbibacter marinus]|uniref:Uncharacterized protein n=1 Tax=Galbibacter marinus TaxID=555500 RepID=K2NZN4_9FLAO|nr:hypothetical protein [Galbibacter marinus]EKF54243.1 hypothetical protein I215_13427 [Galbibacter marinus]
MNTKTKVFLLNLVCFLAIFLVLRFSLLYFIDGVHQLILVLAAAIIASILCPKFFAVVEDGKERVKLKWIFIKGIRNL